MPSSKDSKKIHRRQFIAGAGGIAALASMAAMGIEPNSTIKNSESPITDVKKIKSESLQTDVLVIGGGMAGLFAAVKAYDAGAKVLLISKGRLGASGQTPFAKDFFVLDQKLSNVTVNEFVKRVSKSALGTNNPVYTRQMAIHSQERAEELRKWGFFDSPLYCKCFRTPIEERNIQTIERIVVTHLIKEDNIISGAAGFSLDKEIVHFINAKSIILCTGSGGFKPNGFPICDLTHDGTIMAYKIGAKVTGKEWNDGHTAKATNAAACFDSWGDMFKRKPRVRWASIRHDLGVDINYKAYMNGNPIKRSYHPSATDNSIVNGPYVPDEFRNHPPKKADEALSGGASAGMSIHKSEGLVPINDKCESNIPGLYAAGDALGSYMTGAIYTQAGSSLTGSAVQGAIAGETAAEYSKTANTPTISKKNREKIFKEIVAPLKRENGYSPAWVTQTLQGVMIPNFVMYIKKESILKAALAYIEELRDHHMPMLKARDIHELRLAFETSNMIISAEMKLKASLMRKESRCSHYRLDCPEIDDKNWRAWINIYKDSSGLMKLEKTPFNKWA